MPEIPVIIPMYDAASCKEIFFLNIIKRIKEWFRYMKRNDPCWCGSGKKYKKCHLDFDARLDEFDFDVAKSRECPSHDLINNAEAIEKIKRRARSRRRIDQARRQHTHIEQRRA